jgi:hypothetical protein
MSSPEDRAVLLLQRTSELIWNVEPLSRSFRSRQAAPSLQRRLRSGLHTACWWLPWRKDSSPRYNMR